LYIIFSYFFCINFNVAYKSTAFGGGHVLMAMP